MMGRLIRTFINRSPTKVGDEILLPENEAIHLSRVLRLQIGERFKALDGKGGSFLVECLDISRSEVRGQILSLNHSPPLLPEVRLVIALGKANKWEDLIRPLTELGVTRLTPLITERTEGTFTKDKLGDKKQRWIKIAQEACKQSGNPWMPRFDEPVGFSEVLSQSEANEDRWIASLSEKVVSFRQNPKMQKLSIFIGPEGGWSQEEEANARDCGCSFFSLGAHVLRLETAAVSALAVARQFVLR